MSSNGLPPEQKRTNATSPPPPKAQTKSERNPIRIDENPALDMLFGLEFVGAFFGSSRREDSEVSGE